MKKKIFILVVLLCILFFSFGDAKKASATEYDYVDPESEFRAVWVTPWGGDSDLVTYNSESGFKTNMNYIFTLMEENNLNALIFHVRTHNNAMYKSSLNPIATYWSKVNFNTFDPLEWLISECHKRGIEFHAWLNPYRCGTNHVGSYSSSNPASNSDNTLTYNSSTILNPGLPVVREFIRDTVLEIVENYDVDAIHFDDYFYINMGANGALTGDTTILDEPDQETYENYIDNNPSCGLSKTSASNKADWRRSQVDGLIEMLDSALDEYNQTNHKYVQLGIAPTGVYKNGNGTVTYDGNGLPITTGSKTTGQTHYSSYLFCDTLKWCKEGWIDYILPQTYWATNHTACPYKTLVEWWAKCVKNLPVNFYSGIGLYMAENSSAKNWYTDPDELYNQLDYIKDLDDCNGASIYNFATLRKYHDGTSSNANVQVEKLGTNVWTRKVIQPELKSFERVTLGNVLNFSISDKTLSWDSLEGAKFYCIYRSNTSVTFDSSELVAVVGNTITSWTDSDSGYTYGIRALSYTNTLGLKTYLGGNISIEDGAAIRTTGSHQGIKFSATLSSLPENATRGFFSSIGTYDYSTYSNAIISGNETINEKKIVKKEIEGTDLDISLVIYNIPESAYEAKITTIAYIRLDDGTYRFSDVVTRSLADVAIAAYLNGDRSELVVAVYNYLNSGSYHINYVFNGGNTHYANRSDMVSDFLNDLNTALSTSYTADNFFSSTYTDNVAKITAIMNFIDGSPKWSWLKNFLRDSASSTSYSYSSQLQSDDIGTNQVYWRCNIYAFLNGNKYTSWPNSMDFGSETLINAHNSYLSNLENGLVNNLSGTTVLITNVYKHGYTFQGWYTKDGTNGDWGERVTQVNGSITIYAKWN